MNTKSNCFTYTFIQSSSKTLGNTFASQRDESFQTVLPTLSLLYPILLIYLITLCLKSVQDVPFFIYSLIAVNKNKCGLCPRSVSVSWKSDTHPALPPASNHAIRNSSVLTEELRLSHEKKICVEKIPEITQSWSVFDSVRRIW